MVVIVALRVCPMVRYTHLRPGDLIAREAVLLKQQSPNGANR